jgi:hypothetical protein
LIAVHLYTINCTQAKQALIFIALALLILLDHMATDLVKYSQYN